MSGKWLLSAALAVSLGVLVLPRASASPEPRLTLPRAEIPKAPLLLAFGGDINLGRDLGQRLLREPNHNPFLGVEELWDDADLRFGNLESVLSDLDGETESKKKRLVFAGPPAGANALRGARIDLVSTANNHAWDYGRRSLLETLSLLDERGVGHVGTGADRTSAEAAFSVKLGGKKVAFVAATAVWNQGILAEHPAAFHVSDGSGKALRTLVERYRKDHDLVIVSYHGGEEYSDYPVEYVVRAARGAIDAGADAFIGHHPHVPQGIEFRRGRPIVYSLGNFVFEKVRLSEWTNLGLIARLTLDTESKLVLSLCPITVGAYEPKPLVLAKKSQVASSLRHLRRISRRFGTTLGDLDARGCAPVEAIEMPR